MYATHDTATALQLYSANLVFTSANGATKTREQELTGNAEWQFTMNASQRTVRRGYKIEYERGGPLDWQIVAVTMGTP